MSKDIKKRFKKVKRLDFIKTLFKLLVFVVVFGILAIGTYQAINDNPDFDAYYQLSVWWIAGFLSFFVTVVLFDSLISLIQDSFKKTNWLEEERIQNSKK